MKKLLGQTLAAAIALSLSFSSVEASAEPIPPRETARVLGKAKLSGGIFSPFTMGLGGKWEASAMIVPWLLLSPNLSLRVELAHWNKGNVTVTGEYGWSVPTGAMRLTQGYLFPSWVNSGKKPGWSLTPTAGLWMSGGHHFIWTGRLETTVGIPLGDQPATPLETYAPIELLFAPALTGFRTRASFGYDFALLDWLRARAQLNGYMIGKSPFPPKSPFYVSAEIGLDIGLGKSARLALGGIWYNYDQREKVLEKGEDGRWQRVPTRSNDFFPTVDLIFRTP